LKAVNLKSPTSQFIHAHDFFVFWELNNDITRWYLTNYY
jgi:hypothetical protein